MTTDPRVENLRDAQRRLRSALIANADRLDKPFTDDPDKNPWDTFVRPAMRELKAAVDAIAATPAAPVAAPPTGQTDETTAEHHVVDGVKYLCHTADHYCPAEPHRLALSTALGLGASAPWDAIRERAAELAGQGVAVGRAVVLEEAAAWFESGERYTETLFGHQVAAGLRRLAAETPGPETQDEACGPAPDVCDAATGEPCDDHERRHAHADGEHAFCGTECAHACTCGSAGDAFVPLGHYRDCPAAVAEPHPTEADLRHALAVAAKFHGQAATAPAVVAEPGKEQETTTVVRCSLAILSRPHAAHGWEPQPGMDPAHCPGHTFIEEPTP